MNLNFSEAFSFFMADKRWKFKLFILWALSIINGLTMFGYKGFPQHSAPLGYYMIILPVAVFLLGFYSVLTNNLINEKSYELPELNDWKNIFKNGFKLVGAVICYMLLMLLGSFILVFITGFIGGIMRSFIRSGLSFNPALALTASVLFIVTVFVIWLIFAIVALLPLFFSKYTYSEKFSFKAVFNIGRVLKIFKQAWSQYLIIASLCALIMFSQQQVILIKPIWENRLNLIAVNSIFITINLFWGLILTHLICQAYKYSLAKINNDADRIESLKLAHKWDNKDLNYCLGIVILSLVILGVAFSFPKVNFKGYVNPHHGYSKMAD